MKTLDLDTLRPLDRSKLPDPWKGRDRRDLENSDGPAITIPNDLLYPRHPTARKWIDSTAAKTAEEAIPRLPDPGETFHCVVSGRFPLAALLPLILNLSPGTIITAAQLSTLSFSRQNGSDLVSLIDEGKLEALTLIAAEVFAARNPQLYDDVAEAITKRGHQCRALRTHAKIINVRLSNGLTYTAEGSANLRSAKSIENLTLTSVPGLYEFHRNWIEATTEKQRDRK